MVGSSASARPHVELPDRLVFGRFEIQPRERLLVVDGTPAPLGARAFDLLLVLAGRAGQLVSKHDLLDMVWPGLVVEEANLAVQVSTLRKVLGSDVIATIPGRGYRFVAPASAEPQASVAAAAPAAAVPAASPQLVGREDDLERLEAALRLRGCVTLTGPAGVGKTCLAQALASHWPGGAVWVDLASLTGGVQVQAALERALQAPPPGADALAALIRAIGSRLLILDNAEHLIDATAALATRLLQAAPALHLLVTSQVPLAVADEQVHRIEPLALPLNSDALDLHRGAIALFVERARAADHRFHAGPGSLPLLREICHRLDGLPLALEMAAARVPSLGLSGLRDALHSRFALLTTGRRSAAGRHRTLMAALDWSYGLLNAEEQRLFRAFSVFAGGFTLELAVAVAGDTRLDRWAVIDGLSVLIERSLVATDRGEPPRYRLLETMRAYAGERLNATDEAAALRLRHARALRDLFVAAASDAAAAAAALAEHDNAREALAWAVSHHPALAAEMAPAIAKAATFSPWRRETLAWLQSCEAVIDDPRVTAQQRAAWYLEYGRQMAMSRQPRARAVATRARELYLALQDSLGVFLANSAMVRASREPSDDLGELCAQMEALLECHPEWPPRLSGLLAGTQAFACELLGDWENHLEHRMREAELARRTGQAVTADAAETNVIFALHKLGRCEEALARSTALLARIGDSDSENAAYAWENHTAALIELGRFAEVRALAPQAVAVLRRFDLPHFADQAALMLALERHPRNAARLLGHAHQAYESRGRRLEDSCAANLARIEALVRDALDDATYKRLVAEGRALDEAAAGHLLQQPDDDAG
jgi:predicted ATPase/DNA-binding winged helix-turn-helix (wHTH) protein